MMMRQDEWVEKKHRRGLEPRTISCVVRPPVVGLIGCHFSIGNKSGYFLTENGDLNRDNGDSTMEYVVILWDSIYIYIELPIGSMYAIYMLTFTINIPQSC